MLADKETDEQMAANWTAIQEKYAEPEIETPTEVEAKVETIPVSREPDGKFKAQTEEKEPKEPKEPKEAKPAEVKAEVVPEVEAVPDAPVRDINRAPSTWKPVARAEFDKLSPAIKAEIHRREADFLNGHAQLRPDAELGQSMRKVIEPYRMLIEAEGGTPEGAVADLFRTAALFRTGSIQQKYQAIAQIANQFGLDLKRFSGTEQPQTQEQPQAFRDPRVDQLLAQQQQERQQAQARETKAMESTVTRWMNENDAQGNPKRPYLNDVFNEMSAMIPQIQSSDPSLTHAQALEAAYDRAIWAHPEIRTLLAQQQQADLEAKRRTENQARVADAKRAGSVNVPRRGSTPSPGKPGTMEETIAKRARELGMIS